MLGNSFLGSANPTAKEGESNIMNLLADLRGITTSRSPIGHAPKVVIDSNATLSTMEIDEPKEDVSEKAEVENLGSFSPEVEEMDAEEASVSEKAIEINVEEEKKSIEKCTDAKMAEEADTQLETKPSEPCVDLQEQEQNQIIETAAVCPVSSETKEVIADSDPNRISTPDKEIKLGTAHELISSFSKEDISKQPEEIISEVALENIPMATKELIPVPSEAQKVIETTKIISEPIKENITEAQEDIPVPVEKNVALQAEEVIETAPEAMIISEPAKENVTAAQEDIPVEKSAPLQAEKVMATAAEMKIIPEPVKENITSAEEDIPVPAEKSVPLQAEVVVTAEKVLEQAKEVTFSDSSQSEANSTSVADTNAVKSSPERNEIELKQTKENIAKLVAAIVIDSDDEFTDEKSDTILSPIQDLTEETFGNAKPIVAQKADASPEPKGEKTAKNVNVEENSDPKAGSIITCPKEGAFSDSDDDKQGLSWKYEATNFRRFSRRKRKPNMRYVQPSSSDEEEKPKRKRRKIAKATKKKRSSKRPKKKSKKKPVRARKSAVKPKRRPAKSRKSSRRVSTLARRSKPKPKPEPEKPKLSKPRIVGSFSRPRAHRMPSWHAHIGVQQRVQPTRAVKRTSPKKSRHVARRKAKKNTFKPKRVEDTNSDGYLKKVNALKDLAALRASGALTSEEFHALKKGIMR